MEHMDGADARETAAADAAQEAFGCCGRCDSQTVAALTAALAAKDAYTHRHSQNVSRCAAALALAAGLGDVRADEVRRAGLLHDVGKIGVPDAILHKDGPLDSEELIHIRKHVAVGAAIVGRVPSLRRLSALILCHHERWDGKGYPRGLSGESIPIEARCLSIADSFDAMTSERTYHRGMSVPQALEEVARCAGSQFDPELAETFIGLVRLALTAPCEKDELIEELVNSANSPASDTATS